MRRELSFAADLSSYRYIRRIIRDFRPHIVHTHAAKAGTLGRLAAIHEKVPVIVHTFHGHVFHSYFGRFKNKLFINIERYLASRSSAVIALSRLQKEELVQRFRVAAESTVRIIPLGFDLDRFTTGQEELRRSFRSLYKIDDDVIAIGIIGRLVRIKNHPLFIRAVRNVQKASGKRIAAFIVGDGEDMDLLAGLCRREGIDFRTGHESPPALITFTSWIRNVEWPLAGLDVVALTSINEGTPVSLIEAQAAGKPIVTTEVGGIADIVLKDETAFLCPSGDEQCFTAMLKKVIEDLALRTEIAQRGKAYAQAHFSYHRLASDVRSLYNELLASKGIVEQNI
jgi:glycosyltransferase involved in cell wall biosynthesis